MSVAPEPLVSHAIEQPMLFRMADFGPAPVHVVPAYGWQPAWLAELPMQPAPTVVVPKQRRKTAAPARVLITESEARGLAGTMARAVLESLEGRRPVQQLGSLLNARAIATVQTMLRGGLRWPVRRATVGTVRVFLPSRLAVEACVTFRCDQRTRVLALRIDRERRRWVGTAVRIG